MSLNNAFVIRVSFAAALGGLLFGFDTAIISGAIPYIREYFGMDEYMLGWAVSSILIGCALGAAAAGRLADRFGRRAILLLCGVLFAISGAGAGLAHHLDWFIVYRITGGLGVGAAAMVSPMYIAEIAPAAWRGRLVAFYQLAIVLGILTAYLVNYLFDGMGDSGWRYMFISQAAPSLLFLALLLLVPESPRWLMKKGRKQEAAAIITRASPGTTAEEIAAVEASFRASETVSLKTLFSPAYLPAVGLGIAVAVIQQVTGINSILYYAPVIFRETGLDSSASLLQTLGIGAVNVAATFLAISLVDWAGRRRLMLAGSVVMGLSLALVGLCFHFQYFRYYIVLGGMLAYVGAFGCTLGAVTWVYLSEIFPNRIRATALSLATLALWLSDFLVTYTFPVMTKHLGTAATFFSYAVLCGLAFVFFQSKLKETKEKSLEEIELLFI